jgi:hypothetical protein
MDLSWRTFWYYFHIRRKGFGRIANTRSPNLGRIKTGDFPNAKHTRYRSANPYGPLSCIVFNLFHVNITCKFITGSQTFTRGGARGEITHVRITQKLSPQYVMAAWGLHLLQKNMVAEKNVVPDLCSILCCITDLSNIFLEMPFLLNVNYRTKSHRHAHLIPLMLWYDFSKWSLNWLNAFLSLIIDWMHVNTKQLTWIDLLGIKYFLKAYGYLSKAEELNYFAHCWP